MVQDPRVATLLARLGGVYRDPSRVERDASSLLRSSVGVHLTPGIAPLVENNGDSSHCLVLQGTIAIHFKGMTYQLLVDIYLPPGYPIRPPISYVRLAENMYLKDNHPHVGSDGMVYMPYTHEWNPRTHSLIEMVVAMSSVFSAAPPVFSRAPAPAPPPPPSVTGSSNSYVGRSSISRSGGRSPPPPPYTTATTTPPRSGGVSSSITTAGGAYVTSSTTSRSGPTVESDRYIQEQIEAIMAKEAEEANRAAEVARMAAAKEELEREQARIAAAKEELEREQKAKAQKEWEEKRKEHIRDEVQQKVHTYLSNYAENAKSNLTADWFDQERLKQTNTRIEEELKDLSNKKTELEASNATVDLKTREIGEWLEESKDTMEGEPSVDDACQPINKLHGQLLNLSAENAALTDTLYFLDRGMYMGQIDCPTHLKMVRTLAKRQFLVRAQLIKINHVLSNK